MLLTSAHNRSTVSVCSGLLVPCCFRFAWLLVHPLFINLSNACLSHQPTPRGSWNALPDRLPPSIPTCTDLLQVLCLLVLHSEDKILKYFSLLCIKAIPQRRQHHCWMLQYYCASVVLFHPVCWHVTGASIYAAVSLQMRAIESCRTQGHCSHIQFSILP